jgi:hypothetical protein
MKFPDQWIANIDSRPYMYRGGMSCVDAEELKERVAKHKAERSGDWAEILEQRNQTNRQIPKHLRPEVVSKNLALFAQQARETPKPLPEYLTDAQMEAVERFKSSQRPVAAPAVYSQTPVVEKTKSAPQPPTAETIALAREIFESLPESERQRFGILAALLK